MSEETKGHGLKSGLSIAGVLAAIVSVWWFALRPRKSGEETGSESES